MDVEIQEISILIKKTDNQRMCFRKIWVLEISEHIEIQVLKQVFENSIND